MNCMNLSGNPRMGQPKKMPPTLGHPPKPAIHPRFGTLQFTTGPHQPILNRHFGQPYSGLESVPSAAQYPSSLIFSLGIEPSTTSTNGSSRPASASYQNFMNSSPTS